MTVATKRNVEAYPTKKIFLLCGCGGTWGVNTLTELGLDDIPVCPECFGDIHITEALTVLK